LVALGGVDRPRRCRNFTPAAHELQLWLEFERAVAGDAPPAG
jgi:hypothetical protein